MPTLEWSDALALDLPAMDDTHHEFVDLLAAFEAAPAEAQPRVWQALVDHTAEHFGREDRWMKETRFASGNCHSTQHLVVLHVMREALKRYREGDTGILTMMAGELAQWFPQHAQSMDAALALHMRRVGLDPLTGEVTNPGALPDEEISGCGGASCSSPEPAAAADAAEAAATATA